MAERTWVHAFTDGRDVSPHAAERGSRRAARRPHRDGLRPLLRDGSRQPLGAHRPRARARSSTARASTPTIRSRRSARATSAASPTSSSSRSSSPAARGSTPQRTPRSSSTSGPTARASSRSGCVEAGVDLTTMTRYREDFPFPVAFDEQDGPQHARRGPLRRTACASSTWPRRRSTRTSRTSSTAARSAEWEGETRILVPSPRDVPSYDLKPEMSAAEVADRVCAEIAGTTTPSPS